MGFKFKRVNFTGGAGEWGSQSTARSRAESVVRDVAQALIDLGIGWELDSGRNATTTDFCDVPVIDLPNEPMPGLFLYNIISENRVFIAYIASRADHGINMSASQLVPFGEVSSPSYTGLIMSMIPGSSGGRFGRNFDITFLPSAATPIYGTCQGAGKTNITSYARYNGSGLKYCWGVLATYSCIAIACGYSDNSNAAQLKMCFACGKIFEHLAHSENLPQAKYGVVQFTTSTGGTNAEAGTPKTASVNFGDETVNVCGTENLTKEYSGSVSQYNVKSAACIFKANGAYVGHTATANVRVFAENYGQLSRYSKADDGNLRWVPFTVDVISTNLQNDGIVAGDGLKGLLDTDLFRCARAQRGAYFNNHGFVCAGNCLLIGWDSENLEEL